MAILLLGGLRRGYHLERYIRPEHFELLSKLMLAMSLVMTFVYATEFFMAFYHGDSAEAELFRWRATGAYAGSSGWSSVQQRRAARRASGAGCAGASRLLMRSRCWYGRDVVRALPVHRHHARPQL